jgi:hypothetical protein
MTHDQARQRLQALADEIGRDAPTFFRDRSYPKQLSHPYGTASQYMDNLAKENPDDVATAMAANGVASPLVDIVFDMAVDGRKCLVCEYDSTSA